MLEALFGSRSYQVLRAAFSYEERRSFVIAHNLANVETPAYKRHTPEAFESYLARFAKPTPAARLTGSQLSASVEYFGDKFPGGLGEKLKGTELQWTLDERSEGRADGNNVEPTMEIADLADAELRYSALSQLLAQRYSGIKLVLTDGRR
jgi:flagellar basal-body rod protein FlgB